MGILVPPGVKCRNLSRFNRIHEIDPVANERIPGMAAVEELACCAIVAGPTCCGDRAQQIPYEIAVERVRYPLSAKIPPHPRRSGSGPSTVTDPVGKVA